MTTTYYVKATPNGKFAACSYYSDPGCQHQVPADNLAVPSDASACEIAQADGSQLTLLGASYKTLGNEPVMTDHNFAAASGGAVSVNMPTTQTVRKGVVLIFSNLGDTVATLYPSADPVVTNGEE